MLDVESTKIIVDLSKSLAWPLTVTGLVLLFRKPILDIVVLLTRLPKSPRKASIFGQTVEFDLSEDKIIKEIEEAITELKRAFPAQKSGRFLSVYGSDESAYHVHMIETLDKIGVKLLEPSIFNAVGNYYFVRNKDKSRMFYEKAIHLKQDDVDAHTNMGFWYLLHGGDSQLDFAKQECEIAIQLIEKENGNYPWTYVCLGAIYKKFGLVAEQHAALENARKLFELHIGQDATNFWAHFGLGCCHTEGDKKDVVKAIECDEKVLKIKPDFVPAQYNLACDFALKGAAPEAVAALRRILSGPRDLLKFFGIEFDLDFKAIATKDEFVGFMETMNLKYSPRSSESDAEGRGGPA